MNVLERNFNKEIMNLYYKIRKIGYNPTIFYRMLNEHGGLKTAKMLISAATVSEGYIELSSRKRLDLTVEAFVVENKQYYPLFTELEIIKAKNKLKDYKYKFQDQ